MYVTDIHKTGLTHISLVHNPRHNVHPSSVANGTYTTTLEPEQPPIHMLT